MAGDAYDTIERFWETQNAGDYTATVALFADDAVLEDPLYGTFTGRDAIGGFMAKMNEAVAKTEGSFRLVNEKKTRPFKIIRKFDYSGAPAAAAGKRFKGLRISRFLDTMDR